MAPLHPRLVVPGHFASCIPPDDLSVVDLLRFNLPSINDSKTAEHGIMGLLCNDAPPAFSDKDSLLDVLMPSRETVLALRGHLRQKLNFKGCQHRSIRALSSLHEDLLIPLWVVTYWYDVHDAMVARPLLRNAMSWSRIATVGRVPPYLSHVAAAMERFWSVVGWNVPLPCGPPSQSGTRTIIRLVGIVDLFNDDDMDGKLVEAVIHLFRGWIEDRYPALQDIYLDTLDFQYPFLPVQNPATRTADWPQFWSEDPGVLSHLRRLSDLVNENKIRRLIAPLHTGHENHWAAVEIDFLTDTVHFGDSLELPMARRDRDGITNFLRALRFDDSVTIDSLGELLYPLQNDKFSCGVCTWNTIERTVWPETPPWNARYKQLERLEYALLLATQNGSRYSLEQLGLSDDIITMRHDGRRASGGTNASVSGLLPSANAPCSDLESDEDSPLGPAICDEEYDDDLDEMFAPHSGDEESAFELSDDEVDQLDSNSSDSSSDDDSGDTSQDATPAHTASPVSHTPRSSTNLSIRPIRTSLMVSLTKGQLGASGGLGSFFPKLSAAEAARIKQQGAKEEKAQREERLRRLRLNEVVKEEAKQARKRAQGADRARKCRLKKKMAKEEQQRASINDVLGAHKPTHAVVKHVPVAEASRPRRQFLIDERVHNGPCGRKRKHEDTPAKRNNWRNLLQLLQIVAAGDRARPGMSPAVIQRDLILSNPAAFSKISQQVIGRMILRPPLKPARWQDKILNALEDNHAGSRPHSDSTRGGVLDAYPDLVNSMLRQLLGLRKRGVSVNARVARAIMLAQIQHHAPELFDAEAADGSHFMCSESFVRKFVNAKITWVSRCTTRKARKRPADARRQLFKFFVRLAVILRNEGIHHPDLMVNFDQQSVLVNYSSKRTFEKQGAKQVDGAHKEEKRAWTAVVGFHASGEAIPPQVIMKGSLPRSLPSETAPRYAEAHRMGITFVKNPKNHWSDLPTLLEYIGGVAHRLQIRKQELGYQENQACLLILDCWSVHRGHPFRKAVKDNWPWLRLSFVPGGLTGEAQPADKLVQRKFKSALQNAQLDDIVAEALAHLQSGEDPEMLDLETRIGALRNRSVSWFLDAFAAINDKTFIQKAWRECEMIPAEGDRPSFNLSFESLTSPAAYELLRALPKTDPDLWSEIEQECDRNDDPELEVEDVEDDDVLVDSDEFVPALFERNGTHQGSPSDDGEDDEPLPEDDEEPILDPRSYLTSLMSRDGARTASTVKVGLADELEPGVVTVPAPPGELFGRGKRVIRPTTRFADHVASSNDAPEPEPPRKRRKRESKATSTIAKKQVTARQKTLDGTTEMEIKSRKGSKDAQAADDSNGGGKSKKPRRK